MNWKEEYKRLERDHTKLQILYDSIESKFNDLKVQIEKKEPSVKSVRNFEKLDIVGLKGFVVLQKEVEFHSANCGVIKVPSEWIGMNVVLVLTEKPCSLV